MKVEVLISPGCGHGQQTRVLVAALVAEIGVAATVEVTIVAADADAERLAFPGSPTVRVDGVDVDPAAPDRVGLG